MNLEEVLNFRRSVRRYDKNKPIDPEKVKHCLELATLAPNSSNVIILFSATTILSAVFQPIK